MSNRVNGAVLSLQSLPACMTIGSHAAIPLVPFPTHVNACLCCPALRPKFEMRWLVSLPGLTGAHCFIRLWHVCRAEVQPVTG